MRILAVICGLALLVPAMSTQGQNQDKKKRGGKGRQRLLQRFDKDGDGKLSEAERAAAREARQNLLKEFDKDGDGRLSADERAAAQKARQGRNKGRGKGAKKGRGKGPKKGRGKGRAGGGRFNARTIMARFDKDGDQKLDAQELSAFLTAMRQRVGGPDQGRRRRPAAGRPRDGKKKRPDRPRRPRVNREELIKKFDKDGDGKLNQDERAAARKAARERNGDKK